MDPPDRASVPDGDSSDLRCCLQLRPAVEELFSDGHLAEDGFLLKHVLRSARGFVSAKLLTSLKKIRALTTSWQTTVMAARSSPLLEVNDQLTRVRRLQPLPQWLLGSPTSRVLLVSNLSQPPPGAPQPDQLSSDLHQRFGAYGAVSRVWVLRPGAELPKQLQCYAKRHRALGRCLCAVVQFDTLEGVRKALGALRGAPEQPGGPHLRVVPLGYWKVPSEDQSGNQSGESAPCGDAVNRQELGSPAELSDAASERHGDAVTGSCSLTFTCCSARPSAACSSPTPDGCAGDLAAGDPAAGDWESPWVHRRKWEAMKARMFQPLKAPSVLRLPVGPDDTRGFRGRGRPLQH